jgi:uncharacterized protein YbaA (DUF1428 family)
MNILIAINPTYQKALNRLYKADREFCSLADLEEALDGINDGQYDKQLRQIEAKQEKAFEVTVNEWAELPAREQRSANSQYKAVHGYGMI